MGLYEDMRVFQHVCKYENFSKAAKALNMSTSSVSKAVKRFEETTGNSLLVRNTHQIALTSIGKKYFEQSKDVSNVLESFSSTKKEKDSYSNTLKITFCHETKEIFGDNFLKLIEENKVFKHFSTIIYNTSTAKDNFDFIPSRSDFYIFIGTPKISNLIARKIASFKLSLYYPKHIEKEQAKLAIHDNLYDMKERELNFHTKDPLVPFYVSNNYYDLYQKALEKNYAVVLPDFFEKQMLGNDFYKEDDEINFLRNKNEGLYLVYSMKSLKKEEDKQINDLIINHFKDNILEVK